MERLAKVSLDFMKFTPLQKGLFGDNVIAELTDHSAVFATPDVPIATLTTVNDDLKLKTQQALSGDKEKILERDAAEKVWEDKFRKEAEYVQRIASGDKLIIVQGGYHSTDTEVNPVAAPAQAQVQAWANKGYGSGIHAEMKPLADCRGFVFMLANESLNSSWIGVKEDNVNIQAGAPIVTLKLTTKRKVEFDELSSGQTYYISALGFNATGVGEMANEVKVIAP